MANIKTINVRLTDNEHADLMNFCDNYRASWGLKVSRHSVVKKILHEGIIRMFEKHQVGMSCSDNSTTVPDEDWFEDTITTI